MTILANKMHVFYSPVASNLKRDEKKSIKKFEIMSEMDEMDKLNGLFDK